ncbi:MAG: iron ABC transporter permease [Pseudomonadota bacterium]
MVQSRFSFSRYPKKTFSWLTTLSIFFAIILATPILGIVFSLFQEGQGNWPHLVDTVLPRYIGNSLILMLGVGTGVAVIGVGSAWLVVMCNFTGKRFFEWALILPLAVPAYVVAYAYTDVLQSSGPVQQMIRNLTGLGFGEYWFPNIRSMGGAITIFIAVLYPYVYLLTRVAFLEQSVCALEVSRTLGRSPLGNFRSVALPLARPAIVVGIILALMETLADFGTVFHFGIQTFTTGIYRTWASMGDRIAAAQLSSLLLTFIFLLVFIERYSRKKARYFQTTTRYTILKRYQLTKWKNFCAVIFCSIPLTLGFLAPIIMLFYMHMSAGHDLSNPRYIVMIKNSITLATTAALVAVVLSVFLAYVARVQRSWLAQVGNKIAAMGYAIPGTMIAVGILYPVAYIDQLINQLAKQFFGFSPGQLFTGSITALILAYLVRFMAVSLNTVESSLGKITRNMEDASRTLGQAKLRTVLKVHTPIMSGGLLTAGLIVFVDVMKELPATLIMRPFNFDTLAIQAYNLAKDERLTQAATPSLVIVAVGVLPLIFLSRKIMQSRTGT